MPASSLRSDALRIWQSGVESVRSERLVGEAFHIEGEELVIGPRRLSLGSFRRLAVVGAGKAGAGMAYAVEQALGPKWLQAKQVHGWINVPAWGQSQFSGRHACMVGGSETIPLWRADARIKSKTVPLSEEKRGRSPYKMQRIQLHAARPAGVNEPAPEGVAGTSVILRIVQSLTPDDLCLCLLSGGGSALLPAPVEGVTLEDKLAVTRHLSAAGANIEQLNTVRKQLSRIKGGGLARACRAGKLIALIISDVPGDPLDVIASGPTVPDTSTPQAALEILEMFQARAAGISPAVYDYLNRAATKTTPKSPGVAPPGMEAFASHGVEVTNLIIGNNAKAVDAAGREAVRLGYAPACTSATRLEGPAEEVGRQLAEMALQMQHGSGPNCLISGGEPVVRLAPPERRGLGGRNQQLVLAAHQRLQSEDARGIVLLSGGTDGEDGPTDAAGALLDAEILHAAQQRGLDPHAYLARNDAYHFFAPLGALVKTGPTHTNVGDLRVVLVERREERGEGRGNANKGNT